MRSVESADNQDRFVGRWQDTEMWRLADAFRAQYPEHSRNDAALMLSALTGRLPWPNAGGVNMKPSSDLNSLIVADTGSLCFTHAIPAINHSRGGCRTDWIVRHHFPVFQF